MLTTVGLLISVVGYLCPEQKGMTLTTDDTTTTPTTSTTTDNGWVVDVNYRGGVYQVVMTPTNGQAGRVAILTGEEEDMIAALDEVFAY